MKWIFGPKYSVEWVDDSLTGMPKNIVTKGFDGKIIIEKPALDDEDQAWYIEIFSNKNIEHYMRFRFNEFQLAVDRLTDDDNVDYVATVNLFHNKEDFGLYYYDEYNSDETDEEENEIGEYIGEHF